jgi:hypothetical protein
MRRQGINMNLGVKMFRVTHQKLLQYIRNEIEIPKEIWEKLEHDEQKYSEWKEQQKAG